MALNISLFLAGGLASLSTLALLQSTSFSFADYLAATAARFPFSKVEQVSTTLDYNSPYVSPHSGPALVKKESLGTVYTTFNLFTNYQTAIAPVQNGSIRWPGGSLAEMTGEDRPYDLTFPDLFREPAPGETDYREGAQRGLTEVMAYAVAKDIPFVMIIPTRQYFNNVETGQAHVAEFVTKLVRGDYGPLPRSITLEIGNETTSQGWSNGKFTPGPNSYGYVANAFLGTINSVLSDPERNPEMKQVDVAVWAGINAGGSRSIYTQITPENLRTVDGFVHHLGLVANSEEYSFDDTTRNFEVVKAFWDTAWAGKTAPEMKLIATEWNVGKCDDPATPEGYLPFDVGARQAPTVVNTFSQMIGGGLDMGMLWGNQTCISQMLWHEGETISHGGHAFRMMSENLPGTQLLAGKVNASGEWTSTGDNYDVIGYRDDSKMVIYISAGDIPDAGLDVTVNIANAGRIGSITTETIRTTRTEDGDPSPYDDRIYEVPVVTTEALTSKKNKSFTYRLTEDYELAQIILTR